MRAFTFDRPGAQLCCAALATPEPGPGEVLLRVAACGVCRTDLHLVDGELHDPKVGVIPGHEIVGRVVAQGPGSRRFSLGQRIGVPWLGFACGKCQFCLEGRENLCPGARFTGYQQDGGYAELCVANEAFCFALPEAYGDAEAAPLLCAGLIGYRALRMAGAGQRLGIYGFGAAAHIVVQIARHEGREVFAFVRPGDDAGEAFARELGAAWAGPSDTPAPQPLDAAILFAPVGALVPAALRAVGPGGVVVCAGIHMSDIPAFPYEILWHERCVRSVANLTRRDGEEFLALAPQIPVRAAVETLPLAKANIALSRLRSGQVRGALVLMP